MFRHTGCQEKVTVKQQIEPEKNIAFYLYCNLIWGFLLKYHDYRFDLLFPSWFYKLCYKF